MYHHRTVPNCLTVLILLALLLSSTLVVVPVSAADLLVVTSNADDGDGSLRQAIASIQPGGTITFSPSLSGQTITLASTLLSDKNLTIDGSDLEVPITISGNNAVGVFTVGPLAKNVTLDSLTIINGKRLSGGGIYNQGELTIINSTLSGNNAQEDGGGIYNEGELTIIKSTLAGNNAQIDGGGIFSNPFGTLTVTNSTLSGNFAQGRGGGIYNMGDLAVVNSTLSENVAQDSGGGIYNDGTLTLTNAILSGNTTGGYGGGIYTIQTLNMTDSMLSGNSAYDGGGIYNYSNLEITKSTLSGNTAIGDGGGIVNVGPLTITNSTLSGNHSERGGGILNDDSLTLRNVTLYGNAASASKGGGIINFNGSTLDFINTIIAHSTGGDCVINGTIDLESTHNLVTDGSCGALLDDDPMLGPLANNSGPTLTHALLPGSPAIDAGSMAYCPNTDQRGFYRPFDGNGDGVLGCDIGAFEFHDFNIYLPLVLK